MAYKNLIIGKRRIVSRGNRKSNIPEETESDRARLLFSNSFRRLDKKAQVFALDDNSSVRNRLTHSFEVAHIGKSIAKKVTRALLNDKKIDADLQLSFIDIVETACLMHDIGNPPFGHFGEYSIKNWIKKNLPALFTKHNFTSAHKKLWQSKLRHDFFQFDGNAQGFRIITLLQWSLSEHGLNLSFSQLAASIKYLFAPYENNKKEYKKPGFFYSEEFIKNEIWSELFLDSKQKFPLNYIVEAADDIAYCISDIDDSIEKHIITENDFFEIMSQYIPDKSKTFFYSLYKEKKESYFWFKINLNNCLINYAANKYLSNHDEIINGKYKKSLFDDDDSNECQILGALKTFAKEKIYVHREAENIELAGYYVINGILDYFKPLLSFKINGKELLEEKIKEKGNDLEKRLYNRLPGKHRRAYNHSINKFIGERNYRIFEYFYRVHLILDFIAGMTDNFALQMHQLLKGIKIAKDI